MAGRVCASNTHQRAYRRHLPVIWAPIGGEDGHMGTWAGGREHCSHGKVLLELIGGFYTPVLTPLYF